MAGNSIGTHFKLSTYGESHGPSMGGIIDGCPAGLAVDVEAIQRQLDRRKPGQSKITTQRKESDEVHFLSGIFEGKTTGGPIGFQLFNSDAKSKDYEHLREVYRPSHADRSYDQKYGYRDHRGGGRASARETTCRVVAGALAAQLIPGVGARAWVSAVGSQEIPEEAKLQFETLEHNPVRCPHPASAELFEKVIREARKDGDTLGGVISCAIRGVPPGWGEPVFDKLHADLGKAMLSINAVKGFEIGSGFAGTQMRGSVHNDIIQDTGATKTNHGGGVEGGISNGEEIYFRVAFKPVATLMRDQASVDSSGKATTVEGKGRHDPCVVPRAIPIVESMAYLILADHYLRHQSSRQEFLRALPSQNQSDL